MKAWNIFKVFVKRHSFMIVLSILYVCVSNGYTLQLFYQRWETNLIDINWQEQNMLFGAHVTLFLLESCKIWLYQTSRLKELIMVAKDFMAVVLFHKTIKQIFRWNHILKTSSSKDGGIYFCCRSSVNCAGNQRGGWWHDRCGYARLNGQYGKNLGGDSMTWYTWKKWTTLKLNMMMMRCN